MASITIGSRRERRRQPSRLSLTVFEAKATVLRARRGLVELGRGQPRLRRLESAAGFDHVAARSVTGLWTDPSLSEHAMQLGKVQNLRRAAAVLDGLVLAPGEVFSFWREVGRATEQRGFVHGRMLLQGCLIPAVGGGLCQLSNALYVVALGAGCRIVERHAHSHRVPGSAAADGRDATVAWNYVDLRFAAPRELLLQVRLTGRDLIVSLLAKDASDGAATGLDVEPAPAVREAASCGTCDETDCGLHERGAPAILAGRRAFVVDECWPEFAAFVATERGATDLICAPDFRRWSAAGFAERFAATPQGLMRSLGWRLTPPQGPARRSADAGSTAAIARALARRLSPDVTELIVAQSLAPQLWRDGVFGGRRFSVLMTRLPVAALQARLDAALAAHPDRRTLADYRAESWLADAETEALAAAEEIVTPSAEIAALFDGRARLLDWQTPPPPSQPPSRGDVFAFAGPTVARKGAYEVREVARRFGAKLRPMGAELEGPDFWAGVEIDPGPAGWLEGVCAVVQPALAEAAPRRLLEALAAGVPVIATAAAGLGPQPGLTLVPMGDPEALAAAMAAARAATYASSSSVIITVSG
jgi:hypothetical protein